MTQWSIIMVMIIGGVATMMATMVAIMVTVDEAVV